MQANWNMHAVDWHRPLWLSDDQVFYLINLELIFGDRIYLQLQYLTRDVRTFGNRKNPILGVDILWDVTWEIRDAITAFLFGKIGKIVPELLRKGQVHPCTFVWANLVLQLSNLGSVMSLTQTSVNSTVNSANWRCKMTQLPSLQRPFPHHKKKEKTNAA